MIIKEIKSSEYSKEPIVDLEIKNDISNNTPYWDYERGDVISCAILHKDKIIVIFREKKDNLNSYKQKLKEELDKLPTMYAFNYNFEKGCLKGFLGKNYFIEEIKAFKGKGWGKQKFYEELLRDKKINPKNIPKDSIENDSGEVIKLYEKGEYEKIINHNVVDAIKQCYILKNKDYFLKKYENHINKDRWITDKVVFTQEGVEYQV